MQYRSLLDLLTHELKDIYDAEHRIADALPAMAEAAVDEKLTDVFQSHLEETNEHIRRLEEAFEHLDIEPERVKCDGMSGILKEGEHAHKHVADGEILDAALIAAAQRVEHYEMAVYGTLCAFAEAIGEDAVASLLRETLQEEKDADAKLSSCAQEANARAAELAMAL